MTELLTTPIAHITQEDLDTAEALVAEGHSPQEVRELVAGNSKEIYVDGIQTSVHAIGGLAVTDILSEARKKHEWVETPTHGNDKNA